jgi:alpha-tubulin suppressor-like RCC1 family protein
MAALRNVFYDTGELNSAGVLLSDGRIAAWGAGGNNSLGVTGPTDPIYLTLANGRTAKSVAFKKNNTAIVCDDGSIQVAGLNANGELGTGNTTAVNTFTTVSLANGKLGKKAVFTDKGLYILCTDGTIQASGNGDSYLKSNSTTFQHWNIFDGKTIVDITAINAGGFVALDSLDNIWVVGYWITFTSSQTLLQKTLPAGNIPKQIFAGYYHIFVICTNGNAFMLGYSNGSSRGLPGTTNNFTNFTAVPMPSGKTPLWFAIGYFYTLMVTTDGKVYTTGGNDYGQLAINNTSRQADWVQVTSLKAGRTPIAVYASSNSSYVIYDDGSVQSAGYNTTKELGDGTTTQRNVFTNILSISGQTVYSTTTTGLGSAPGAPTITNAVGGNGQVVVSFNAPANDGGSTITSYTVTASPGGATASGASSPITVTGLTNGTGYTFTVTATNSSGTSSASSASSTVTPSIAVSDLNTGNISKVTDNVIVSGGRSITARKLTKSAGAVNYAPDAATKPSVAISNIPATVQDVTVGVATADASGIAVVKIVAQDAENNLITDFSASPLTVRVTLPGFTSSMVTIQTSATLGGAVTDTITGYRVGTNLYEFTTTHLTYFSASAYVPCLVAGTRVLTASGYKTVEELSASDMIRTADGRIVPFRMFTTTISATSPETAPYTIPARTFGASPAKDLTVSPYHAIQSAPGVWQIPKYASRMFEGITQAPAGQPITYYHLELPNYFKDNLVVEGTVTESYGNRQTVGMKTVYKFRPELNGFSRLDKPATAKKSLH